MYELGIIEKVLFSSIWWWLLTLKTLWNWCISVFAFKLFICLQLLPVLLNKTDVNGKITNNTDKNSYQEW